MARITHERAARHLESGFSLVELSIVLVILGLLVGGVLGGQTLIRAAELRNISVEYDKYITAVNTFQEKYMALPGDLVEATRFWGRADTGAFSGQCASPAANEGTGERTCNGNGDGKIPYNSYEVFRFWEHLANAGLIDGIYSGVTGTASGDHHLLGENAPLSKISNVGWGFDEATANHAHYWNIPGLENTNTWVVGVESAAHGPEDPAFEPQEVWNIDMKIDDGKPGTGRMFVARDRTHCTTVTSTDDYASAEYNLEETGIWCRITFPNAF